MSAVTKKKVAKSLVNILDNKYLKTIKDLSSDIAPIIEEISKHWQYDLFKRKPGPALNENGAFVGTDLDLACFLAALVERGAVIKLPKYESMRAKQKTAGQRVIMEDQRFGKLLSLISNKDVFSFSVRIFDNSVVVTGEDGSEEVGAYRNFTIVDPSGKWFDGWHVIEFSPSAEENKFIFENDLLTGNSIVFENFVHPNRWISLYGQYYFITKALINRIEKQAKFYNSEIERLIKKGVSYPAGSGVKKKEWPKKEKIGKEKSVTYSVFESEVDFGDFENEFKPIKETSEELKRITDLRRKWIYKILPTLRFAVRATELAFFKFGFKSAEEKINCYSEPTAAEASKSNFEEFIEKMPGWIKNAKWQRNYKQKGKRKEWNRLILTQPGVGELGISIRYRIWDKQEKISV